MTHDDLKAAARRWLADKNSDGIAPNQSTAEDRAALADFAASLLDETPPDNEAFIAAEESLGVVVSFYPHAGIMRACLSAQEIRSLGQLRALLLACGKEGSP